ncbi:MAG: hypothetical protein IKO40_06325, partial [Kiritimatiellae bacterium]|nr:hypothetical protein [Kiritimatiellia bacterium]
MNALVTRLSSLVTAIAALSAAHAAEVPQLSWRLPPCAHFEDNILVVDVPAGDRDTGVEAHAHCEADIDLSPYLEGGRGAVMRVRVRARDVSKPDFNWNGVKCMFRYVSDVDGTKVWPGFQFPLGTFDWCTAEVRVNWLNAQGTPRDGKATLVLGLQGCTGHAEFDLSTVMIESEELGIPRVNEDYIVHYPNENLKPQSGDLQAQSADLTPEGQLNAAQGRRPLRGVMSPGRNMTEDDVETLHRWGATLVRFQITRN